MRTLWAAVFAATALLTTRPLEAQDNAELFDKLDANKDGFVTGDEVPEAQKGLFERLLRNSDKDGDKKLSKEEFQAGLKPDEAPRQPLGGGPGGPGRRGGGQPSPQEIFNRMDANRDGKLSKDELPTRMQENFARLDSDGDGTLNLEELSRVPGIGSPPPGAPNPGNVPDRQQLETLFDRTDSNSDGKLTKDEIPEERPGMRGILERSGGDSLTKEQFIRGWLTMAQQFGGQPPQRPEGAPRRPDGAPPRPEGTPRPDGAPPRRPDGPPGAPPGGGLFGALDADRNGELSTIEIAGAGAALLKLDRNGDGKLTPDEVFGPGGPPPGRPANGQPPAGPPERRPGQRGLGGLNPEEFLARMKEADVNKDGKVSKEEAPPLIKDRFDRVDANGDGFVDEAETRQMLQRMRDGGGKAAPRRPGEQPRRPDNNNN